MIRPDDQLLAEICMSRSLSDLGDSLERLAREQSGCPSAFYYAYDANENALRRLQDGSTMAAADDTLPGQCAVRWQEVSSAAALAPFDGAALAIPVHLNGCLVGVLAVGGSSVDDGAAERVRRVARVAGHAQDLIGTRADLGNLLSHTQDLLVKGAEVVVGRGHVRMVVRIASELGQILDLSARSRELLWQAASYHDVGWLILHGESNHDVEDRHVQAAVEYLSGVASLRELVPVVAASHERWDGSGYPHGLSGDQVPLEGWILSLAEDLTEQIEAARDRAALRDTLADFFAQRATKHHPAALDALSGLIDAGRLEEVVGKPLR